jgi:hypothetical protein
VALNNYWSGLMRAFSLIVGVLCLAGCTGPDIIPIQGSVPPLAAQPGSGGAVTRMPLDAVSASPADAASLRPETPQGRYDSMVRQGQMREANRLGVGVMTGSQPCASPTGVIAPPTSLSKPCTVAPLDDFSLRRQQQQDY